MIDVYNRYLAALKINISQLSKDIIDNRRNVQLNQPGAKAAIKLQTPQVNLFSDQSCVVFVSLAQKFACVTKTTNNVEDILGYS